MNYPTILMLLGCMTLAAVMVYRYFIRRRLRLRDVFYLGHVFVLGLVILMLVVGSWMVIPRLPRHRSFDRESWIADSAKRVEMADDLLQRHLLDGKPEAAVRGMLGAPMCEIKDSLGYRLGYYLGIPKGPFSTDPDFLIVDIRKGHAGHYYVQGGVPFVDWP